MDEKALGASLLEYVDSFRAKGADPDSIDIVMDCLGKIVGVDFNDKSKLESLKLEKGLLDIFQAGTDALGLKLKESTSDDDNNNEDDEIENKLKNSASFQKYLQKVTEKGYFKDVEEGSDAYKTRYKKLVGKYIEKFGMPSTTTPKSTTDDAAEEAIKQKEKGNAELKAGNYEQAVLSYTKAIELSPSGENTHIYYNNRAAAYLYLNNAEKALEDCSIAIGLAPDYAKAHARYAAASLRLGNNDDAKESAMRTLELDPNNASAQTTLKACGGMTTAPSTGAAGGPPGGLADMMASMQGNPAFAQMKEQMQGGGGMPNIASMMNDPNMMQMAQQMMQDPNMMQMAQQMMQDPNAMSNMMNMFGGAGGAPPQ